METGTQTPQPVRLLLTADEACKALSISRTFLYHLLAKGEVSAVKLGSARRFSLKSIEEYVGRLLDMQKAG